MESSPKWFSDGAVKVVGSGSSMRFWIDSGVGDEILVVIGYFWSMINKVCWLPVWAIGLRICGVGI